MFLNNKSQRRDIQFDFHNSFKDDFFMLKFLGMYFLKEKSTVEQKIYWFLVNFSLVFLNNLAQTINLFYLGSNLKNIARSGYIVTICCMASIKSFYFFKHSDLLTSMEHELNINIFQPKDHEGCVIATKALRAYKMTKRILFILCTFACLGCLARPMFIKGSDQILPMASWYPFDVSTPPVYEIMYFHQCLSISYTTFINIYSDLMVAAFSTFIGLQCDLLYQNTKSQHSLKCLKELIAHHKYILNFAKNTEALFNEIYFFQFCAVTLALCMTLFLLTVSEGNSFEFFSLLIYGTAIVSLLLVPCWFSSEMQRKSQQIPLGVYSLPWTTSTNRLKKDVLFFMQRAQEPIIFHVMGLFPLSVDTFSKIIRSSFSYYTVLNNMNMKHEGLKI